MLEFGNKTIIATYNDAWLYRMEGYPVKPQSAAVYGTCCVNGEVWAVSRDMRKLLDWIDGQVQ